MIKREFWGYAVWRGRAGSPGSGGASALPAPGVPASTCHYIRSAYYRVYPEEFPRTGYRISPEAEGAQFPRTRTITIDARTNEKPFFEVRGRENLILVVPFLVARNRSSIVIALELILVLDFCHWLPREHLCERKSKKLALIQFILGGPGLGQARPRAFTFVPEEQSESSQARSAWIGAPESTHQQKGESPFRTGILACP